MKVTLRKFLEITNEAILFKRTVIELYIYEWNELFEEWQPKMVCDDIHAITELEPYLDYEIVRFAQEVHYELESQSIYIRKIEDRKEK